MFIIVGTDGMVQADRRLHPAQKNPEIIREDPHGSLQFQNRPDTGYDT